MDKLSYKDKQTLTTKIKVLNDFETDLKNISQFLVSFNNKKIDRVNNLSDLINAINIHKNELTNVLKDNIKNKRYKEGN
jgi:hypothetical protein